MSVVAAEAPADTQAGGVAAATHAHHRQQPGGMASLAAAAGTGIGSGASAQSADAAAPAASVAQPVSAAGAAPTNGSSAGHAHAATAATHAAPAPAPAAAANAGQAMYTNAAPAAASQGAGAAGGQAAYTNAAPVAGGAMYTNTPAWAAGDTGVNTSRHAPAPPAIAEPAPEPSALDYLKSFGGPEVGEEDESTSEVLRVKAQIERKWRYMVDSTKLYRVQRWIGFAVVLSLFMLRIYIANGWFIVTYGLGIYLLNLFIGFLSPPIDPTTDGPVLPTKSSAEFRPFTRRVPEFVFWYSATKATVISICMTFFNMFDIPVFWPILLFYFIVLFGLTMKRQIKHMIKHGYVPWTQGKKTFRGKK